MYVQKVMPWAKCMLAFQAAMILQFHHWRNMNYLEMLFHNLLATADIDTARQLTIYGFTIYYFASAEIKPFTI